MELRVTAWNESAHPTEPVLAERLTRDGLNFYAWSNGPFDVYEPHTHAYDKVIYVVRGSTITFHLIEHGTWHKLNVGDRLDLPTGIVHAAEVGEEGVVCLEAHCG